MSATPPGSRMSRIGIGSIVPIWARDIGAILACPGVEGGDDVAVMMPVLPSVPDPDALDMRSENRLAVTFGVEEEFLLLDPTNGAPVLAAPMLLRLLAGEQGPTAEFMRYQIETVSTVCTGLGELREELLGLRQRVAGVAAQAGCRLVASGIAPYHTPGIDALTEQPRYQEIGRRYPMLAAQPAACGCHVHVGVPSRNLGVGVLARLRPWLATLLALTANSPITNGRDSGWASWRYPVWSLWPTALPPAVWPDDESYDATVRRLIRDGAAIDERAIYFLARLSPRYPTVEVRVADTCLDLDVAVLLAAMVRGLVVTAMDEVRLDMPLPPAPTAWITAGLAAAARHGLPGPGVDPFTGQAVAQRNLLRRLLCYISRALDTLGDTADVTGLLRRLDAHGSGADRQRAWWVRAESAPEFIEALAHCTVLGIEPAGAASLAGAAPRHDL